MKNHFLALLAICSALGCANQSNRDPATASNIPPAADPKRETNPSPNSTNDLASGPSSTPVSTPMDTPDRRDSNTFVPASRATSDDASGKSQSSGTSGHDAATTQTGSSGVNQGQGSGTTTRSTPTSDQATQDAAKRGANTASTGTQPANTKQNKVDRDSASVTPTDQGESETDRKITQEIRQAVMRDGTLSFTAKNVKIITSRGKVTLRGSVKSDQERTTIVAAAKRVAGVTDVDDQIEVNK